MEYDPLLAKLAVWGETRELAIERMLRALGEFDVAGIRTNLGFFRQILEEPQFRAGNLHTGYIEEVFGERRAAAAPAEYEVVAALVAALHTAGRQGGAAVPALAPAASAWRESGRSERLR